MPKTIKNIFYQKLTFEKMYEAYDRAKKNKTDRKEVMAFEYNLEFNLIKLINEIKNDTYYLGEYRCFKVYEPKERVIKALPFRDRVVHQWYVHEFLIPNIVPKFIYDSYACIKFKGTHRAMRRLKSFMYEARRKYGEFFVIKMDISKFFYNIDSKILFQIMTKYFKDKALLKLTSTLIFDAYEQVGIPIGNYTSQYFANIYLNELDYFIKHDLKLKYYLRFMDDFVIIVESKEIAKDVFQKIESFVNNNLKLKLNHKSRIYPSHMGIDFCGYRMFYTHTLVRNRSKNRMKKNIKRWNKSYQNGKLDIKKAEMSLNSWEAHIKHADSYNLHNKYISKIDFRN